MQQIDINACNMENDYLDAKMSEISMRISINKSRIDRNSEVLVNQSTTAAANVDIVGLSTQNLRPKQQRKGK